jgi:hypothetical protein
MSEQELNLFKLASSLMAKPGTGSTEIMWSNYADAAGNGRLTNYGPNHLRRESMALNSASLADGAEERSIL